MKKKQKELGNGFRFNISNGNVIAKTITSNSGNRMDDNFIKCVQVGQLYGTENEQNPQAGRIYDSNGISPTMDTCSGGNRMPKIIENPLKGKSGKSWQFEQSVYSENSKCVRTIKSTEGSGNIPKIMYNMKIRKMRG